MNKKFYNDAIIGNNKITACLSKNGEIIRLFYPSRDYRQFIENLEMGIKINDSAIIYLHDDINNLYKQYYTENTNIINTKIYNTYFNIEILQTDFVSINNNIIIRKYTFTNKNSIDLNVDFLSYAKLLSNENNSVGSRIEDDICMQYSHDYTFCTFSKNTIQSYRLNNSREDIKSGVLYDKDYIGMAKDTAVSFKIGNMKPNETKEFVLYFYINENTKCDNFDAIIENVKSYKEIDVEKELLDTESYWKEFVNKHDTIKKLIDESSYIEIKNYKRAKEIYIRSILLFPILTNRKTGGISAAIEADENKQYSGRYSYCWPRDAVFVTKALDILNMKEDTKKFYEVFCKKTQSENGMWEQRFYTDGKLAPCWGYQIDETASIVYGIYEHYKMTEDVEFLNSTYEMCIKAYTALKSYIRLVLNNQEINESNNDIPRFKTHESYDLWEMNEGVSIYSLGAIYAGLTAMIEIERIVKNEDVESIKKEAEEYKQIITKYYNENLYNEDTKTIKRNNKDNICDISVLGTCVPFQMINVNDEIMKNTVNRMNLNLRTYTGGYIRFENDNYMGGNNPWDICTLWMAMYNIKTNNIESAIEQLNHVINSANVHGFLPEQVDNETMTPKWIIGLGWSHAMYIITLYMLFNKM